MSGARAPGNLLTCLILTLTPTCRPLPLTLTGAFGFPPSEILKTLMGVITLANKETGNPDAPCCKDAESWGNWLPAFGDFEDLDPTDAPERETCQGLSAGAYPFGQDVPSGRMGVSGRC